MLERRRPRGESMPYDGLGGIGREVVRSSVMWSGGFVVVYFDAIFTGRSWERMGRGR